MNADEIVRALRDTVENGNERPQTSVTNQCKDCYLCEIAADAIDELQDKLFEERNTSQALRYAANGDRTQPDSMPIVRCGECYKRNKSWCPCGDWTLPKDSDYCSYGERKEQ